MSTLVILVVATSLQAATEERPPDDIAISKNLAPGRPYTFSVWPTVKFWLYEQRGVPLPDTDRLLTDGRFAKTELFVLDHEAVVFGNATTLEIVVDLGDVQPIGEIWARHESNAHRSVQPLKQEYYVSDDGETFYKAAELKNTWDPPALKDRSQLAKFFKGVKLWSSGPIRTKGRYVMIKTYPLGPNKAGINPGHIGCDEIGVMRGRFRVHQTQIDRSKPYVPSATGLPSDVLGYRYALLPWGEMFREGPLFYALNPYELLMENEYHLSIDGVYIMTWHPVVNSSVPKTDIEFECTAPAAVEVLSTNRFMKVVETKQVQRNGRPYIYRRMVQDTTVKQKRLPSQLLVVGVVDGAARPGPLGKLYFRYGYKADGKSYAAAERSIDLVLQEKIAAPAPKELVQGMWFLRIGSAFSDLDQTAGALVRFYKDLGFNAIWGAVGPEVYRHARKHGMLTVQNGGTRYAGNGFTFAAYDAGAWKRVPEAGRFQFHPTFAKGKEIAQYTFCPTMLASPDLFPLIKEQAAKKLETTDWIEENWEPHMFEKRGCVCELCKRAFQEFSRLPASRVESLWPDCVVDMNNKSHNQFTAHQMAQAMLTFDRAWREASREMGRPGTACYVPAVPPHIDFTPDSDKFKIRGASEYVGQLNALTMWGVPFAIKLGRVHLPSLVGHNLVSLDEIRASVAMADRHGRQEAGRRRPRLYNMSGIQFGVTSEGKFVMPRVFYFQTVLDVLEGLDGHASYREYGVDARFMRLRAEAARIMATYESYTLHGEPKANFTAAIASPAPNIPERSVLYTKSCEREGSQIIALGNDGIARIYVTLTLTDLEGGKPVWLVDRMAGTIFGGKGGFGADELVRGVLIDIPHKEFRILEVHRELTDPTFQAFAAVDETEVRAKLDAEKDHLAENAERLESLAE